MEEKLMVLVSCDILGLNKKLSEQISCYSGREKKKAEEGEMTKERERDFLDFM